MSNRPSPQDYKNDSVSPTKILGQPFQIVEIIEDDYEGKPQLCVTVQLGDNEVKTDVYVSNRYVMRFLRDIDGKPYMTDSLLFFKSTPNQRHYEIGWADEIQEGKDIPF